MRVYLVYDKKTGRVLHNVSKYLLGNPDPVQMSPEEVLAELPDGLRSANVGIASPPEDFDPRERSQRPVVDPRNGVVTVVSAPPRVVRSPRARLRTAMRQSGRARKGDKK